MHFLEMYFLKFDLEVLKAVCGRYCIGEGIPEWDHGREECCFVVVILKVRIYM
jgi:hypothetical protein